MAALGAVSVFANASRYGGSIVGTNALIGAALNAAIWFGIVYVLFLLYRGVLRLTGESAPTSADSLAGEPTAAFQAGPNRKCGRCGKPLSPVWTRCEHCKASYGEFAPVARS